MAPPCLLQARVEGEGGEGEGGGRREREGWKERKKKSYIYDMNSACRLGGKRHWRSHVCLSN